MNMAPIPEKKFTINEATREIEMIWGMIGQFGAVTNEKDLLDNLVIDMKSSKITPDEAVERANLVMTSKNGFGTMYR